MGPVIGEHVEVMLADVGDSGAQRFCSRYGVLRRTPLFAPSLSLALAQPCIPVCISSKDIFCRGRTASECGLMSVKLPRFPLLVKGLRQNNTG